MADINLSILNVGIPTKNDNIIFNDLRLDLTLGYTRNNELARSKEVRDVLDDINIEAVGNGFINLLKTSPGQKPLNPRFGIDFGGLLFLPVTEKRAEVIGTGILDSIAVSEPRINIVRLTVTPDENNQEYICNLIYSVPRFNNERFKINGRLSKNGFSV